MELLPGLKLGWLDGWLPLVILYGAFGILLIVFPREVVSRLYDRSDDRLAVGRLCPADAYAGVERRTRLFGAVWQRVSGIHGSVSPLFHFLLASEIMRQKGEQM